MKGKTPIKVIKLPQVCGHYSFESALSAYRPNAAARASEVVFDFSGVSWIGVLPLSILHGWIRDLRTRSVPVPVSVLLPEVLNLRAAQLLSRMGYWRSLQRVGANLIGHLADDQVSSLATLQFFHRAVIDLNVDQIPRICRFAHAGQTLILTSRPRAPESQQVQHLLRYLNSPYAAFSDVK